MTAEKAGYRQKLLDAWVGVVAREFGGTSSCSPRGSIIEVKSSEWEERSLSKRRLLVAYDPHSHEDWQNRLRIAEQMAARAIISRPYSFVTTVQEMVRSEQGSRGVQVLRCAFSLAVVSGPLRLWRMTAYHLYPWDLTCVTEGGDDLFSLSLGSLPASKAGTVESLNGRVEKVRSAIDRVQEKFAGNPKVREIRRSLKERLHAEVKALRSLYFDRFSEGGVLQGLASTGLTGSCAIEGEYRRRLESIIERHTLVIKSSILSTGLIFCKGKRRKRKHGFEVFLPFVQLDDSNCIS